MLESDAMLESELVDVVRRLAVVIAHEGFHMRDYCLFNGFYLAWGRDLGHHKEVIFDRFSFDHRRWIIGFDRRRGIIG